MDYELLLKILSEKPYAFCKGKSIDEILDITFKKYLAEKHKSTDISGKYIVNASKEIVTIEKQETGYSITSNDHWKGSGVLIDDAVYKGNFQYTDGSKGEHLLLITPGKNLVGIWHSETHGFGRLVWLKDDGRPIPYPALSGDAYDMNAPYAN